MNPDARFIGVLTLNSYSGTENPYTGVNARAALVAEADFSFIDSKAYTWTLYKGDVVDGANIPNIFKPLIGGAFQSPYLPAAALHDVYCRRHTRSWQDTHEMFYEAMVTNGVPRYKAWLMWSAVYVFGPKW